MLIAWDILVQNINSILHKPNFRTKLEIYNLLIYIFTHFNIKMLTVTAVLLYIINAMISFALGQKVLALKSIRIHWLVISVATVTENQLLELPCMRATARFQMRPHIGFSGELEAHICQRVQLWRIPEDASWSQLVFIVSVEKECKLM